MCRTWKTVTMAKTSPYLSFSHDEWAQLASTTALPLTAHDVDRLSSLGDPIDVTEADAIYRPLAALMQMYAVHTGKLFHHSKDFLGYSAERTPWIVGIAGSVSVGKSTSARLLQELMRRWPATPNVALVTTDGYLLPNAVLEERGLMNRKGFPESYDRYGLLEFLDAVKAGATEAKVPVYDHVTYDVVPGEYITISNPDVIIVEGLNVLQPAKLSSTSGEFAAVSDYFDFTIYLDAPEDALERWYIDRFLSFRSTAFSNPNSYFRSYADLTDEEAVDTARNIWRTINLPNLRENVAPTRSRATVVLEKGPDHRIETIQVRRL